MLNSVEYKQASRKKLPGTDEVFVLNQFDPVYVKRETLLTGKEIISVKVNEDRWTGSSITIKLSSKGMRLINKAVKDRDFPMLVFYVNGKSIRVIHHVSKLDGPEMIAVVDEDKDFVFSLAELIKSGMSA